MMLNFEARHRKGVTPIIAVILLLMMTIAIAGLSYVFIQRYQSNLQSTTENVTKRSEQAFKVNLKVEGYNTTCGNASSWVLVRINVRNSGAEPARNVQLFIDYALINCSS
ncbi:TPA: hypothetical protein H1005_03080, partial [archaeon]|nr:hypothetical protein [Candidatus Naiadarchaeales archaeon SRR2090153.bin1042]